MSAFEHLLSCSDLTEDDIDAACASREDFHALLAQLAQISAPNTGCSSVLKLLARLAGTDCDWLDGDVAIELLEVDDITELRVMTELGAGMRERVFPAIRLRAPLAEVAADPKLAGSLRVTRRSWKRVTLDATEYARRSTRPPRISDTSLVAVRPATVRAPRSPSADAATSAPRVASRAALGAPRPAVPSVTDEAVLDAGWDDMAEEGSASGK